MGQPRGFSPPELLQRQDGAPQSLSDLAPVKPRKVRKRRVILGILVLLLLICGGLGALLAVRQGQIKSSRPTAHATPGISGVTPVTSQVISTDSSGTIGQPIQAGENWVATVTHVDTTTTSDFSLPAGKKYLEVSVTLTNVSANMQPVSSQLQFTLADANGGEYGESTADTYIRQAVDGTVAMSSTLKGQIAYQVPRSIHQFTLTFHYGFVEGSSASISWQLSV